VFTPDSSGTFGNPVTKWDSGPGNWSLSLTVTI